MPNSDKPLHSIFELGDLKDPYLYAGLLGRYVGKVMRDKGETLATRKIDRLLGATVLRSTVLYGQDTGQSNNLLWHGTGRYQYRDGEYIDVLKKISNAQALLPKYDAFDLDRPMCSVSLARSRMYARAYADMHGNGSQERERYGNSLFWACTFMGDIAIEAALESRSWSPRGYRKMMNHLANADTVNWYKKMTSMDNPTVLSVYRQGSDIAGNYPILFGVDSAHVRASSVSRAVDIHEVRSEEPIAISSMTHIEVPRSRLDTTAQVIGHLLPVVSLEDSENIAARYSFSQHMASIL